MERARLESIELLIAKFLRYGVILAGVIIFVGWMFQINFSTNIFQEFHVYKHAPLGQTIHNEYMAGNWGLLTSYLGLGILISLPFIRVLLTAIVFIYEKDYLMAACALVVIAALIMSLTLGFEI